MVVEKKESYTVLVGMSTGAVLKKLNIQLLYGPAISLLQMNRDITRIPKDLCTSVFMAVLFTIAKTWKHPKCSSTKQWIKNMCCTYIHM